MAKNVRMEVAGDVVAAPKDPKEGEELLNNPTNLRTNHLVDHPVQFIDEDVANDEEGVQRRKRFLNVPQTCFYLFLFFYICAVAAVYYFVEGANEEKEKADFDVTIRRMKDEFAAKLAGRIPSPHQLEREIDQFSQELLKLGWTKGRQGVSTSLPVKPAFLWTPANCLLFATSLIARIGYGHLVPLTMAGRLLTIPLALLGIPLFLAALMNFGKSVNQVLLLGWCRRRKNGARASGPSLALVSIAFLLAWLFFVLFFAHMEGWAWTEAVYFVFITASSIGFGDFAPSTTCTILMTILLIFSLFVGLTMLFDLLGPNLAKNVPTNKLPIGVKERA